MTMKRVLVTAVAAVLLSGCAPAGGQRPGAVVSTDAGPVCQQ